MRVALVHDFLTQLGGAERVLQCFHELFPEAPVYTLVYDKVRTQGVFEDWKIRPSFLQKLPWAVKKYKWFLGFMPAAIESFNFNGFDLVLSDSSAFAKGIITRKSTVHICYCHTPTRYLWESMDEYLASLPYPAMVKFSVKPYLKHYLKGWDYAAAQRPNFFIANSDTVKQRIKQYYNRDSEVIYPPVDTEFFNGGNGGKGDKGYYFTASRLEPYKKIDLVIEAFANLGLPLKVAGTGTQILNLKSIRGGGLNPNIEFLGRVSDEELRDLYCSASAFVFPALEDAGIMVLEALSCGTPVIGLAKGGTAEFIRDGQNGVLFENQTTEDIVSAVKRFSAIGGSASGGESMKFDSAKLRESVLPFDKENFKKQIMAFISSIGIHS